MRELKFDALSPDGTTLILVGKDGQKWSLAIDERIEAAVRRDRARMSQVEIEQSGELRPREIQARIRSGATAEDVAASSGLPLEHIRRFEGPVLTERAWVAQQAQSTEVRRPGGDIPLGELVVERLDDEGVDPDDITWDAWRRDDGSWVVIATFPVAPNTHVATWTYDSSSRTMTVVDDNAASLSAIDPDAPLHLTAARPTLTSVTAPPVEDTADDDTSVTVLPTWDRATAAEADSADKADADEAEPDEAAAADPDTDSRQAAAVDPGADADEGQDPAGAEEVPMDPPATDDPPVDLGATGPVDPGHPDPQAAEGDLEPEPEDDEAGLFPTPSPAARPARKRSVPSFDDILFGPGPGPGTPGT